MEGPGRLRKKTATPVPMRVVRHSGCSTSATTLRQPRASERMWRRREEISVWGSLDHQKCPTIRRYGGVDSMTVAGWNELSEGYDGGVSGHNGPVEQFDTVLVGVA